MLLCLIAPAVMDIVLGSVSGPDSVEQVLPDGTTALMLGAAEGRNNIVQVQRAARDSPVRIG